MTSPVLPPFPSDDITVSPEQVRARKAHLMTEIARLKAREPVSPITRLDWRSSRLQQITAVAAAAAVIAALGVGTLAALTSDKPAKLATSVPAWSTMPSPDARIVMTATTDAMNSHNVIVHATQTNWQKEDRSGPQTKDEFWIDPGENGNFRQLAFNEDNASPWKITATKVDNGKLVSTNIDYFSKTVIVKTTPATDNATTKGSTGVGDIKADAVIGHDVIDGVNALHLRNAEEGMNREIWVSEKTSLPVRMTAHGSGFSYVIDYEWMPRNDDTLKLFTPETPAGFKLVKDIGNATKTSWAADEVPSGAELQKAMEASIVQRNVVLHRKETMWNKDNRSGGINFRDENWLDPQVRSNSRWTIIENHGDSSGKHDTGSFVDGDSVIGRSVDFNKRTVSNYRKATPPTPSNGRIETMAGSFDADVVTGHVMLDGVDALHLTDGEPNANREVWVSAETSLPIQMTAHAHDFSYVITWEWVQKTPEVMRNFLPPAPEGFTVN